MPVEHDHIRALNGRDGQGRLTGADRTTHPQTPVFTQLPGQQLADAVTPA